MTVVRGVLLVLAALALLDGDVWQAVGLTAFVVVLFVVAPGGLWGTPRPLRVSWRGWISGRW